MTAFRNRNGSVATVVLNTATTAQTTAFSVRNAGPGGRLAVPYLTDATDATAVQPPVPVRGGRFTATLPARSLVTYVIPARS